MPAPTIHRVSVFEDAGVSLMARVYAADATILVQADLSSITCSVYDVSSPSSAVATPTVTISSVVFDTLQTDARWTEDSTGYNFRHDLAATVFATPGKIYRVEYKFTQTGGEIFFLVFEVSVVGVYGS